MLCGNSTFGYHYQSWSEFPCCQMPRRSMAAIGSKNAPTDGYEFACSAAGGHGQGEQKGYHVYSAETIMSVAMHIAY